MKGYIAISSVIFITAVMSIVGAAIAFTSFVTRSNTLADTNKQQSTMAANACIEQAVLNLALNSGYVGNEQVTIPGSTITCTINQITISGSNKTIQTVATVNNSTTRLQEVVQSANLAKVSYQEL